MTNFNVFFVYAMVVRDAHQCVTMVIYGQILVAFVTLMIDKKTLNRTFERDRWPLT